METIYHILHGMSREQLFVTVVAASGCVSVFAGAFGAWLAAYVGGRGAAKRAVRQAMAAAVTPPPDARITHLSGAVDAMALEIERISEGQRFLVKVLSEREAASMQLPPIRPAGSPTPH